MKSIRVATCQFSVEADVDHNRRAVLRQIDQAARQAADVDSANDSTTRPSRWGSFAVRPDGQITGQLRRHQAGVLMTDMPLDPDFFDAPGPWRESAMNGQLHSGALVQDERSLDGTCL